MTFLAGQDSNPAVVFLANENDAQYLKEAIWFFFVLAIVKGTGAKRKDLVGCIGLSFLRAFGDLNVTLALGLGGMPGAVFQNLDHWMSILIAAIAFAWFSDKVIPADIAKHTGHVSTFCHSVIKANNAGAGYAAVAAALPGSWWGPLIGAYLGVNGARVLEKGMGAIKGKPDADGQLAIMSGLFIYITTTHLAAGAVTARALLVLFSYSQNFVNWEGYWNQFTASISGGGAAPKKGRKASR